MLDERAITPFRLDSCTAANGHVECTAYTTYVADRVFFGFLLVGGNWILNTAFPEPLA
jgi:hypothetical protein